MKPVALAAAVLIVVCGEKPKAPASEPAAPARPSAYVYVSNEDSGDLTVIDLDRDSVVSSIPVGARPRGIRASADGKFIYVALSGSPKCPPTMPDEECEKLPVDKSKDGVAVVDAATHKLVRTLPGGSDRKSVV